MCLHCSNPQSTTKRTTLVTVFVSAMDVLARCNDRCVVPCVFQLLRIPPLNSGNQESRSVQQGCTNAAAPSQQTESTLNVRGGQKNTPKGMKQNPARPCLCCPGRHSQLHQEKSHLRLRKTQSNLVLFAAEHANFPHENLPVVVLGASPLTIGALSPAKTSAKMLGGAKSGIAREWSCEGLINVLSVKV